LAKGKANPCLSIWVYHPWIGRPEIAELHDAGHRISAIGSEGGLLGISGGAEPNKDEPDLILHPAAHAWGDAMWETPYLKAALTAARKRHRERKKS